jgi:hypothetical protein
MILKSNIVGVISRTMRLRNHDIPAAMKASLDISRWETMAFETAEKTLSAIAQPGQEAYVRKFLTTLRGTSLVNGFILQMRTPFGEAMTVEDATRARSVVNPVDRIHGPAGGNLFLGSVDRFEAMVTEWVAEEKDKDKRDMYHGAFKPDWEIGAFISWILLAPNPSPKRRKAIDALMPHIADFIRRKQEEDRLDVATSEAWLKAVLAAWCKMVRVHFGAIFKAELDKQRSDLALPI